MAIFLFLISTQVMAQTYVKVSDRAEYEKYIEYCNSWTNVIVTQWCKVPLMKLPDGNYTDSTGFYINDHSRKEHWYSVRVPKYAEPITSWPAYDINLGLDYYLTGRSIPVVVRKRKHSVRDFYQYWMTDSIKH